MEENTNKALAINSLFLYGKLLITTVCGLFTTRFALLALGVDDFGLFSIVGSIISFIAIFNTIMLATSNRFMSVAIGRGSLVDINEQFNVNFTIHAFIAVITLCLALPLGDWFILSYLRYSGDISNALWVFHFALVGSVVSFIGVPYNGLLMAKERFVVFCGAESMAAILKLIIAYLLIDAFREKLFVYALSQAALTATTTLVYWVYCRMEFMEIVKFKFSRRKDIYKEVFAFSGWVAYGAVATVGKNQGAAILVNVFFSTAMNTALGLANTVHSLLGVFANSVAQPMAPQVTKNYAQGNISRCSQLLVMSTKYTFIVMMCISAPFLVKTHYVLSLWLGSVPPYVAEFTVLIIIDTLVGALNSGISNVIFASGKIRLYQISINTLRIVAIGIAYVALKMGAPAPALLYVYIIFSIIIFIVSQLVLHHTLNFDNRLLIMKSYIPSVFISILFAPLCFVHLNLHPVFEIIMSESYLLLLVVLIGLTKRERFKIMSLIKKQKHEYKV